MSLGIVVRVPVGPHEIVVDFLWTRGAPAITETFDGEMVVLRTSLGDDHQAVARLLDDVPHGEWHFEELDDSLADEWRRHARETVVGPHLRVVPAWLEPSGSPNVRDVRIEPGPTFGLGDHPTTLGCLQLIERLVRPGSTVLDVGCGSGVLGITALVLGAGRAHGIDVMPAAVEVSRANAERNAVADRWTVSTGSLAEVENPSDLVVANILAPVLVELADDLRRLTAPGGRLVYSGVLDGNDGHVARALGRVHEIERVVIDGWASVVVWVDGSVDE